MMMGGGGRRGERRRGEECGAPSLQNEDPTPQDGGWEKKPGEHMQYTPLLGPARMKVGMASRGSAGLVAPPVRAPAAAPPAPAAARRASAAARTPRRQRSPPATSSSSPKSSSKRTSPAGRTGEPVRASARRSMRPRGCGDRSKLEPKWLRRSLFRGWASCASSAHTSNGKHAASDPASSDRAPGAPRQSEEAFARRISKTAALARIRHRAPWHVEAC